MDIPEFIEPAEPNPLQYLVAELQQQVKSESMGLPFPVSVRLESNIYGCVEAFAHQSGSSRNKIINQLLEIAIDATLSSLPADLAHELTRLSCEFILKASEKASSSNGGQA